jgi:rhodanese-related sulfurtransferase
VAGILVDGVVLGLAYNWTGLRSRPPRGVPWLAVEAAIPDLETLTPHDTTAVAPGPSRTPSTGSADTVASVPEAHASREARPKPAAVPPPAPSRSSAAGAPHGPGTTGPATGPGEVATPPAPTPAPSSPSAAVAPTHGGVPLPFIPETSQPVKVRMATVKAFFDADAALIIDARDATDYEAGHIPRAARLTRSEAVTDPGLIKALPVRGRPIIVYCEGGECEASLDLAKALIDAGFRKVLVYAGGFPEWSAAGQPVERGKGGS